MGSELWFLRVVSLRGSHIILICSQVRKLLAKRKQSDSAISTFPQKKSSSDDIDLFQVGMILHNERFVFVIARRSNKILSLKLIKGFRRTK